MKQMPPRLAAWYGLDDDGSAAESSVQSTTRSGTTYQPTSSITSAQSTRQSKEKFTVSLPLFAALAIAVSLASIVNKDQSILQFEGDGEGYLWEDDDDVYATTIADSNTDIITIEMPTTPENTSEPSLAAGSAAHAHASLRPRKAYASLLPPVPPPALPALPASQPKQGPKPEQEQTNTKQNSIYHVVLHRFASHSSMVALKDTHAHTGWRRASRRADAYRTAASLQLSAAGHFHLLADSAIFTFTVIIRVDSRSMAAETLLRRLSPLAALQIRLLQQTEITAAAAALDVDDDVLPLAKSRQNETQALTFPATFQPDTFFTDRTCTIAAPTTPTTPTVLAIPSPSSTAAAAPVEALIPIFSADSNVKAKYLLPTIFPPPLLTPSTAMPIVPPPTAPLHSKAAALLHSDDEPSTNHKRPRIRIRILGFEINFTLNLL